MRRKYRKTLSIEDRFERYIHYEPMSGCWLWGGSANDRGYSQITVNGKPKYVHRISYEIHVGQIPDGLFVCHKCDVSACVNPDHLFLGTPKDNVDDMIQKGRKVVQIGEECSRAKLTEEEVLQILDDARSNPEIAKDYNVVPHTISDIKLGKTWKHIERSDK